MNEIIVAAISIVSFCFGLLARYLFQYLIKKKEFKFRIEEKMIERSLNSLCELFSLLGQMGYLFGKFELVDEEHFDRKEGRQEVQKEIMEILKKAEDWFVINRFYLPKEIKEECKDLFYDVAHQFAGVIPYKVNEDICRKLLDRVAKVNTALEKIFGEYNPFYDVKIPTPKEGS